MAVADELVIAALTGKVSAVSAENLAIDATITSSEADSSFPVTSLGNTSVFDYWKTDDPPGATPYVDFDLGSSETVQALGFAGMDLDGSGSEQWQWKLGTTQGASDVLDDTARNVSGGVLSSFVYAEGGGGYLWVRLLPQSYSCRWIRCQFSSLGGQLRAAVPFISQLWQPANNVNWGYELFHKDVGVGGSERQVRGYNLKFDIVTDAERAELSAMSRILGKAGRFLLIPRPNTATTYRSEALYCSLSRGLSLPNRKGIDNSGNLIYRASMAVLEAHD